jgi:hypothetical protein
MVSGFPPLVITNTVMPARPQRRQRQVSALCPNCDERFASSSTRDKAYCGTQCHGEAKAVRYGRAKHRQYGKVLPADITEALGKKVAHALGGGYDRAARSLSKARRVEVWRRDGCRCVTCGAPGEDIDHIDGSSDDLTNLRLLCRPCHRQITDEHMKPISDPAMRQRAAKLRQRVKSTDPLCPCDAEDWQHSWRRWVRGHLEYADLP